MEKLRKIGARESNSPVLLTTDTQAIPVTIAGFVPYLKSGETLGKAQNIRRTEAVSPGLRTIHPDSFRAKMRTHDLRQEPMIKVAKASSPAYSQAVSPGFFRDRTSGRRQHSQESAACKTTYVSLTRPGSNVLSADLQI